MKFTFPDGELAETGTDLDRQPFVLLVLQLFAGLTLAAVVAFV